MAAKDLDAWREKIDALNEQILALVNARAECAIAVGEIKRGAGLPLYAPDREMAVLDQIKSLNKGPLSHEAVQRIFKQIIDESLPPNPKEFVSTLTAFFSFLTSVTGLIPISSITFLKLIFGKATLLFRAKIEITDSIAPAAPSVCPV